MFKKNLFLKDADIKMVLNGNKEIYAKKKNYKKLRVNHF